MKVIEGELRQILDGNRSGRCASVECAGLNTEFSSDSRDPPDGYRVVELIVIALEIEVSWHANPSGRRQLSGIATATFAEFSQGGHQMPTGNSTIMRIMT